MDKARCKADVTAEAQAKIVSLHFGNAMGLCHRKDAEPPKELQQYKGRVVFRADKVNEDIGFEHSRSKERQLHRWQQLNF